MADGTRGKGDRKEPPDDEAALSARLQRLGKRLATANRPSENGSGPRQTADASAFARGFRLSTELVAGVLVGAVIGWLLDRWLGISPWGLIVFLLLGFAAGVLNVMRAAGVVRDRQSERLDDSWPSILSSNSRSRACSRSPRSATPRSPSPIRPLSCWLAVLGITVFLVGATASRGLVPVRLQSAAEIVLRIRRHDRAQHRRLRRHEVLPVRVLDLHVRADAEHDRPDPLLLHGHQPHHRHRCAGAHGVLYRADLRPVPARLALLQPVRAEGRADLHPAADRRDRDPLVRVAADLAQRASVRQHAGGPHHAAGLRRLHHPARRRPRRRRLDRRRAAVR